MSKLLISSLLIVFLFFSCKQESNQTTHSNIDFEKITVRQSNVKFNNQIQENNVVNTFKYLNAYGGGGVGIGDINNDGLDDIYFSGNQVEDRLYLNEGDFKFKDITSSSGIGGLTNWSSGVNFIDINNDGYLDIYVCRAFGNIGGSKNKLFINKGDLTFEEKGAQYGIDDDSWSTQSVFLDFDLDGDLDLFVANHLKHHIIDHALSLKMTKNPLFELSNHFYINNGNNKFVESSKAVGIYDYCVSLGISVSDFNSDGYPDIYVANDQQEPDLFYINQQDGTFKNELLERTKHISYFSMGIDAADIDNDGFVDLMVCDMMAENNYRNKAQMASMNPDNFWTLVKDNYHYQYMHNVLQLNDGNGNFKDIAYLSGVSNTDWSWAVLFPDIDRDGYKDIFITNGVKKDILDKDFIKKTNDLVSGSNGYFEGNINDLLELAPSTPIRNKLFINNGEYEFKDYSDSLASFTKGFSNGAAYSDLDNDGDLDLVINNINDYASILKNESSPQNNFLKIRLKQKRSNTFALGSKVYCYSGQNIQLFEQQNIRGFKSSMSYDLLIGLKKGSTIDSLKVVWPDNTVTIIQQPKINENLTILKEEGLKKVKVKATVPSFKMYTEDQNLSSLTHIENQFDDYNYQLLLPHKLSHFGPALAVADINNDGLEDLYLGGSKDNAGKIAIQNASGDFIVNDFNVPGSNAYEDIDAIFLDIDNDNDNDLYVVSGGNEFDQNSKYLKDRIYINDGSGKFSLGKNLLPNINSSGSCVRPYDYDNDGDLDLFIGGRLNPRNYPESVSSYFLKNNNGVFEDQSYEVLPQLKEVGMVTDAEWVDINNDDKVDLVLVGEWMGIKILINDGTYFTDSDKFLNLSNSTGWWNSIQKTDVDLDGDFDLIVGNLGLNYKYKTSEDKPFNIHYSDFDNNGTKDIVLGYYEKNELFPVRGKQCSSEKMSFISDKFKSYRAFGKASLVDIYSDSLLSNSTYFDSKTFKSVLLKNNNDSFKIIDLPIEAQMFPVQDILITDINNDGYEDLFLVGNFYVAEVETGRADAGEGLILTNNKMGYYTALPSYRSGIKADIDARKIRSLQLKDGKNLFIVANNDDKIQAFIRNTYD